MAADVYAAADGPKRPPGLALRRSNMRIFAKRLSWPAGALQACWDLEKRHPGWLVSWLGENTFAGFERPAGYRGVREGFHRAEVFATEPAKLAELIDSAPPPEHNFAPGEYCPYCLGNRPWRAGF